MGREQTLKVCSKMLDFFLICIFFGGKHAIFFKPQLEKSLGCTCIVGDSKKATVIEESSQMQEEELVLDPERFSDLRKTMALFTFCSVALNIAMGGGEKLRGMVSIHFIKEPSCSLFASTPIIHCVLQ